MMSPKVSHSKWLNKYRDLKEEVDF